MYLTLVMTFVGILFILVVSINVIQQYKKRIANQKRSELTKQRIVMDECETILANMSMFPVSNNVVMIIYARIEEGLLISKKLTGTNQFDQRINVLKSQMQALKNNPPQQKSLDQFVIPDSEQETLTLVQTLRHLKELLRTELQKGKIPQNIFSAENQKIAHMQLRINVDNTISRAQVAIDKKQFRTAKQMLTKAVNTLTSLARKTPDDRFVSSKLEESRKLLGSVVDKELPEEEAKQARLKGLNDPAEDTNDDDDAIFGEKKKW